jgi:glutamate 5-kinase
MKMQGESFMKKWKRIVVKVGTSTLTYPSCRLNIRRIEKLVKVLSDIRNSGTEVLLVSSGAIAMGVGKLGLSKRPSGLAEKQACAAVGQCELMYIYDKLFSEYNHNVAQVLLTGSDLKNPAHLENVRNTIHNLIKLDTIPVLNENDTVSTDEITSIGDNDTLAALVCEAADADLLILLSDIDGLYTADPNKDKSAEIIHRVSQITPKIRSLAGGSSTSQGTGGMATKVNAAAICLKDHIDMVIANGSDPLILYDILQGKEAGTLFSSNLK